MNEETNSAEKSMEEEVTETDSNVIENVDKIEFEDEDSKPELPIDYERKLSDYDEEEEELPFLEKKIKETIEYLDGKSRKVVTGSLVVFLISIINFIAWNFTETGSELSINLEYLGTFLSFLLLLACAAGILISYNVYTAELDHNKDIRISGLILSTKSLMIGKVFIGFTTIGSPLS